VEQSSEEPPTAGTEAFKLTATHEKSSEDVEPEHSPAPEAIHQSKAPHSDAANTAPRPAAATGGSAEPPARERLETPAEVRRPDSQWQKEDSANTTTPLRQMTVRVPADNNETVSIRFAQRGEAIDVAVRASRPEVAADLRRDVPDLVEALHREGFRSDLGHTSSTARHFDSGSDRLQFEQQPDPRGNGRHRPDPDDWTGHKGKRRPPYEAQNDE
jgi:hypothetical protein